MSYNFAPQSPNPEPLFGRIAGFLRDQGLAHGDVMPTEAALAARFGVGRPQVREALSVLEGFGAIASRRGAARVWLGIEPEVLAQKLSHLLNEPGRRLTELLDIRHALETTLLQEAAAMLTPADIHTLKSLANGIITICARGESFEDLDEEFHRQLFHRLQNRLLDGILASFWATLREVGRDGDSVTEDPVIAAMHLQIIDAIEAGDIRLAVHHMDAHFFGIRSRSFQIRETDSDEPSPSTPVQPSLVRDTTTTK